MIVNSSVITQVSSIFILPHLLHPQPLEQVGLGLAFSVSGAVVIGVRLLHETGLGLLDTALSKEDLERITTVLEYYREQGIMFHALRSRQAGSRRFVSFQVLVSGSWTVLKGHSMCEEEAAITRGIV